MVSRARLASTARKWPMGRSRVERKGQGTDLRLSAGTPHAAMDIGSRSSTGSPFPPILRRSGLSVAGSRHPKNAGD